MKGKVSDHWTASILVVDDSLYIGKKVNKAESILSQLLKQDGFSDVQLDVVPNDTQAIRSFISRWVYEERMNLILILGGIGLLPFDDTSEATLNEIDRRLEGLEDAIRAALTDEGPSSLLFRGAAGVTGNSLIIYLPNKPEWAEKCLRHISPAIKKALYLITVK